MAPPTGNEASPGSYLRGLPQANPTSDLSREIRRLRKHTATLQHTLLPSHGTGSSSSRSGASTSRGPVRQRHPRRVAPMTSRGEISRGGGGSSGDRPSGGGAGGGSSGAVVAVAATRNASIGPRTQGLPSIGSGFTVDSPADPEPVPQRGSRKRSVKRPAAAGLSVAVTRDPAAGLEDMEFPKTPRKPTTRDLNRHTVLGEIENAPSAPTPIIGRRSVNFELPSRSSKSEDVERALALEAKKGGANALKRAGSYVKVTEAFSQGLAKNAGSDAKQGASTSHRPISPASLGSVSSSEEDDPVLLVPGIERDVSKTSVLIDGANGGMTVVLSGDGTDMTNNNGTSGNDGGAGDGDGEGSGDGAARASRSNTSEVTRFVRATLQRCDTVPLNAAAGLTEAERRGQAAKVRRQLREEAKGEPLLTPAAVEKELGSIGGEVPLLYPYIPSRVVQRLASSSRMGTVAHFHAAVLCVRLPGISVRKALFSLATSRDAASQVARRIEQFFSPILSPVVAAGGDLAGFHDDALYFVFGSECIAPGLPNTPEEDLLELLPQACKCAQEIGQRFEERADISLGVSQGRLTRIIVGSESRRWAPLWGPAISEAAAVAVGPRTIVGVAKTSWPGVDLVEYLGAGVPQGSSKLANITADFVMANPGGNPVHDIVAASKEQSQNQQQQPVTMSMSGEAHSPRRQPSGMNMGLAGVPSRQRSRRGLAPGSAGGGGGGGGAGGVNGNGNGRAASPSRVPSMRSRGLSTSHGAGSPRASRSRSSYGAASLAVPERVLRRMRAYTPYPVELTAKAIASGSSPYAREALPSPGTPLLLAGSSHVVIVSCRVVLSRNGTPLFLARSKPSAAGTQLAGVQQQHQQQRRGSRGLSTSSQGGLVVRASRGRSGTITSVAKVTTGGGGSSTSSDGSIGGSGGLPSPRRRDSAAQRPSQQVDVDRPRGDGLPELTGEEQASVDRYRRPLQTAVQIALGCFGDALVEVRPACAADGTVLVMRAVYGIRPVRNGTEPAGGADAAGGNALKPGAPGRSHSNRSRNGGGSGAGNACVWTDPDDVPSRHDAARSAVLAALALADALENEGLQCGIGCTVGNAFVGDVGARLARSWCVLGEHDRVASLLSEALLPGGTVAQRSSGVLGTAAPSVLCDIELAQSLSHGFEFAAELPVELPGYKADVMCREPVAERESLVAVREPLLGRAAELSKLAQFIRRTAPDVRLVEGLVPTAPPTAAAAAAAAVAKAKKRGAHGSSGNGGHHRDAAAAAADAAPSTTAAAAGGGGGAGSALYDGTGSSNALVMVITGPPGIGKTRLVEEFTSTSPDGVCPLTEAANGVKVQVHWIRGSQRMSHVPFYPLRPLLLQLLGVDKMIDLSVLSRVTALRSKAERVLRRSGIAAAEYPFLNAVLPVHYPPTDLYDRTPAASRHDRTAGLILRILSTTGAVLAAAQTDSSGRPIPAQPNSVSPAAVLLVIDDAHLLDQSTWHVVRGVLGASRGARAIVIRSPPAQQQFDATEGDTADAGGEANAAEGVAAAAAAAPPRWQDTLKNVDDLAAEDSPWTRSAMSALGRAARIAERRGQCEDELDDLRADGHIDSELVLGPLPATLVRDIASGPGSCADRVPKSWIKGIHTRTGGNPLWFDAVLRCLEKEGAAIGMVAGDKASERVPLPPLPSLPFEAVRRLAGTLSSVATDLLAVLAVSETDVDRETAAKLIPHGSGYRLNDILAGLSELTEQRFLTLDPVRHVYSFRHAIHREAGLAVAAAQGIHGLHAAHHQRMCDHQDDLGVYLLPHKLLHAVGAVNTEGKERPAVAGIGKGGDVAAHVIDCAEMARQFDGAYALAHASPETSHRVLCQARDLLSRVPAIDARRHASRMRAVLCRCDAALARLSSVVMQEGDPVPTGLYARALGRVESAGFGNLVLHFDCLFGLWRNVLVGGSGDWAGMVSLFEAFARDSKLLRLRVEALHVAWTTPVPRGMLAEGETSFARVLRLTGQALELYDAPTHHSNAFQYVKHDARSCALGFRSAALSAMARPHEAMDCARQALEHALNGGHPGTVAQCRMWLLGVHLVTGFEMTGALEECLTVARDGVKECNSGNPGQQGSLRVLRFCEETLKAIAGDGNTRSVVLFIEESKGAMTNRACAWPVLLAVEALMAVGATDQVLKITDTWEARNARGGTNDETDDGTGLVPLMWLSRARAKLSLSETASKTLVSDIVAKDTASSSSTASSNAAGRRKHGKGAPPTLHGKREKSHKNVAAAAGSGGSVAGADHAHGGAHHHHHNHTVGDEDARQKAAASSAVEARACFARAAVEARASGHAWVEIVALTALLEAGGEESSHERIKRLKHLIAEVPEGSRQLTTVLAASAAIDVRKAAINEAALGSHPK